MSDELVTRNAELGARLIAKDDERLKRQLEDRILMQVSNLRRMHRDHSATLEREMLIVQTVKDCLNAIQAGEFSIKRNGDLKFNSDPLDQFFNGYTD